MTESTFRIRSVRYPVIRSGRACGDPEVTTESIAALQAREREAYLRWWALFRVPDVWSDRQKRQAMYSARREYQEAVIAVALAVQESPSAKASLSG